MKKPILHLTRDDFKWDYFRAGGKGGQNQNKVSSACRCTHVPSGVSYESRSYRDQPQNRVAAFKRVTSDKRFITWLKLETYKKIGALRDIEAEVDRQMASSNIRVEILTDKGWKPEQGGVPERSIGPDCKSGGEAFEGSNPSPTTKESII